MEVKLFSGIESEYLSSKIADFYGFNLGDKMEHVQNDFDIVYALDENEWNGFKSVQLLLKDLK